MKKHRAADKLLPSKIAQGGNRNLAAVNSIIIHTTGYGAGLKRLKEKHKDPQGNLDEEGLGKIGKDYAKRMANILKYKGHFLIDHLGVVYQFLPLSEVAWHTGSSKRRSLNKAEPAQWWASRWEGLKRPTDLPAWVRNSPNKSSVGIDLLAHGNGAITMGYTEAQYQSLTKLISALCEDLNIPRERKHIVGHEDVDPISRGNKKAGWDPGVFDYDGLMDSIIEPEAPEEPEPVPNVPPVKDKEEPSVPDFKKVQPLSSITDLITNLFRAFFKK
jgi:hypothetical protein